MNSYNKITLYPLWSLKIVVIFYALVILTQSTFAQQTTVYKRVAAQKIYTADTNFRTVEAMVYSDGKIVYLGKKQLADSLYPNSEKLDFPNQTILPGFIDAHTHLLGYAKMQVQVDLTGAKSVKEIIKRIKKYQTTHNQNTWIIGRGWDQTLWQGKNGKSSMMTIKNFQALNAAFPNQALCLSRVDGHAIWINEAAIKSLKWPVNQASLVGNVEQIQVIGGSKSSPYKITVPILPGGSFELENGAFTGVCIDAAANAVKASIPEMPYSQWEQSLKNSVQDCYKNGIIGITEAGLGRADIDILSNIYDTNPFKLRIYALRSADEDGIADIMNLGVGGDENYSIRGVKFYLDGALGSRGALLKEDYCDHPGSRGLQLMTEQEFFNMCYTLTRRNAQVCVHAIGDSANAIAIRTFKKVLPYRNDLRWRIEHAQVVDRRDLDLLQGKNVIPSIQPTHAMSDSRWAEDRLCGTNHSRLAGAYAYKSLLISSGKIALGTDFPVEAMNPLATFTAATLRLDIAGKMKQPFLASQALSAEETLWGMTRWAAFANFAEGTTGSLEVDKAADFIVLNQDIIEIARVEQRSGNPSVKQLKKTQILGTYINGNKVY